MRSQTTPRPPAAQRIPAQRVCHGDTFVDEYAWLADKDRPEVAGYLRAENTYAAAMTQAQAALRTSIFEEIKIRTKETDCRPRFARAAGGTTRGPRKAGSTPSTAAARLRRANPCLRRHRTASRCPGRR